MYIGLHVKYPLFVSDCNETRIFLKDFGKVPIKFNANPSSGNGVVPCGERTVVLELIATSRSFANLPKRLS